MAGSISIDLVATPKNVLGLAALFLVAAAIFGALNNHNTQALRLSLTDAESAKTAAEARRAAMEKQIKARDAAAATAPSSSSKTNDNDARIAKVQSDLEQAQKEKAELGTKLQENETAMAALQKQLEMGGAKPGEASPGVANPGELQAQLDEARKQLESAEREKSLLTDKLRSTQERSENLQEEVKRSQSGNARLLGLRGTVLAVNQAYNFVVLNMGGRQGVEANSEMLVLRGGAPIGRIRISSVEPATAIGDIITSSLARGVQVQPGDIVIYAGSNS
jgi:myosin heavy subunit